MPRLLIHTDSGVQEVLFEGERRLRDLIANNASAPTMECGGLGVCGKCLVMANGAMRPLPDSNGEILACRAVIVGDSDVYLPSRSRICSIETSAADSYQGILAGATSAVLQDVGYGFAVDLGTTTIAIELVDKRGNVRARAACENPQRIVAADVIGRIGESIAGKAALLRTMATNAVEKLKIAVTQAAALDPSALRAAPMVIAGNTAMLHLYCGLSVEPLSRAPFGVSSLFGENRGNVYLPPCPAPFVGADCISALLASGIDNQQKPILMLDIGTNAEIALCIDGKVICSAAAAGPAFEGFGIASGIGAVEGAVDSVSVGAGGSAVYTTIGRKIPAGLCGSGLVDLVATLLLLGKIDCNGVLADGVYTLADGVRLEQRDVRALQLAKGAIAAGVDCLLAEAGIEYNDISEVFLAGGFGSHLNLKSAATIGLIPQQFVHKTHAIGNAALAGATMQLLSTENRTRALNLASRTSCINLATLSSFQKCFMENLSFY